MSASQVPMFLDAVNAEIKVLNTFLHVSSKPVVQTSFSEPLPILPHFSEEEEEEVMPWRTHDSYEEEGPFVAKVSTLEYFEQVSTFNAAPFERGTDGMEPVMKKISTFDFFDAPLTPYANTTPLPMHCAPKGFPVEIPVAKVESEAVDKISTYDFFDAPLTEPMHCSGCGLELTVRKVDSEPPVESVSTFDSFEGNGPSLDEPAMVNVSTFDFFEDAPALLPLPLPYGLPLVPCAELSTISSTPEGPSPHGERERAELTVPEKRSNAPLQLQGPEGKEQIHWKVDARKLESQEKQILSPEFELTLPGVGPTPFRLMILAKETRGKGCRGFLKAKGRGRLFLKCGRSSLPESDTALALCVTIGRESKVLKAHHFAEHSCCPLQEGKEDWDLLSVVDQVSRHFEVDVEVLRHE